MILMTSSEKIVLNLLFSIVLAVLAVKEAKGRCTSTVPDLHAKYLAI